MKKIQISLGLIALVTATVLSSFTQLKKADGDYVWFNANSSFDFELYGTIEEAETEFDGSASGTVEKAAGYLESRYQSPTNDPFVSLTKPAAEVTAATLKLSSGVPTGPAITRNARIFE